MNFPKFSCFFLNNLFSSYLDPPSSFISAAKGADANESKLLLFWLASACSNYLIEGKHPKETKSTRDLSSWAVLCYIQEPEHNSWLTQSQKMSSGAHLMNKAVTLQFSLLGCACCSFNILVSHIHTIYLVHSSNGAMKHTGPSPKFRWFKFWKAEISNNLIQMSKERLTNLSWTAKFLQKKINSEKLSLLRLN